MPTVAIYPRKSKFAEQSESVANQVTLCKEHCDRRFDHPAYLVYDEDEGFSGKNTHRPAFQRLMADLKERKFDILCCYRLDRISRSVSDFSSLLDDLQRYNVAFVSLREQFDTSTPIGRAMVYIASVFAQLERETLAERVRDNLYELAKSGRWLGGVPPIGYEAISAIYSQKERNHKVVMLSPVESELRQVIDLFQRFVESGSVSKLLTYCLQQRVKSRNGIDYSRTTLRFLLTNPVYCTADEAAWEYFHSGDFNLCAEKDDFDGVHGVMPFNRSGKVAEFTQKKPTAEWIISVGKHPGALPGQVWVQAQKILENNKELGSGYKAPRTEAALLSGVIRCGKCGSYMRPKVYGKPLPDGTRRFSYICTRRIDSRGVLCDEKNAPGNLIDAIVVDKLRSLAKNDPSFSLEFSSSLLSKKDDSTDMEAAIHAQQKDITEAQRKIDNLVDTLSEGVPASAKGRILKQIDELENKIQDSTSTINKLNSTVLGNESSAELYTQVMSMLSAFSTSFDDISHDEKRRQIRALLDDVTWNGEEIKIDVLGAKTLPK